MEDMNGRGGATQSDPNEILNELSYIEKEVDRLMADEDARGSGAAPVPFKKLRDAQTQVLNDTNSSSTSPSNQKLDYESARIMDKYRELSSRIGRIKKDPRSQAPRNQATVNRVERRVRNCMQEFQQVDGEFRRALQEQMRRQYKIVRSDASESEIREAVEDTTSTQVFSQALLQSGRQQHVRSAMEAVESRHVAIQKIERQVIELAQLFEDMNVQVLQQEPVVTQINQQSEVVHENVNQANTQLDGAISKARAANRKKWYCLGIALLIIIIIVIIVVIVVKVGGH